MTSALAISPPFPLRVTENQRFLVDAEGRGFFYLADTAWELFHRLDRADSELFLKKRADQGFTVIQAVVLAEEDGLRVPNANGDLPLIGEDPTQPNEAYFQHVDWVVNKAAELGLVTALLPTWGDKWNQRWGVGPEVFTVANARVFGEFLGRRYKDAPIIWMLGGDRPIDHEGHIAIMDAFAAGIHAGTGGSQLITFHNCGSKGSSDDLHNASWLDFNTFQSGHAYNRPNWKRIEADYALEPAKPCLDAEPGYEEHPSDFKAENGYLNDYDVRKFAYWAVFAGAFGHTYGCHCIWQFNDPTRFAPKNNPRLAWKQALDLPGAGQMVHLRRLIESRPFITRIPDQGLLAGDALEAGEHLQATRDADGSYAMIYLPRGGSVHLRLDALRAAEQLRVSWFDPRTGQLNSEPELISPAAAEQEFTAPTVGEGQDWVLLLDDASQDFPAL